MFAPAHLRTPRRDRWILGASLVALSGIAWLTLVAWEASPYGHLLHHAESGASLTGPAVLFTVGWVVMIVAMMLPSSIPLVLTFAALTARRRQPRRLVVMLLTGYLVVWGLFGMGAWLADRGLHAIVASVPWLAANPRVILAATLLGAGLWQFSPLRDRCLDACRSPLGFVMHRWRGTAERREAFAMGVAHGASCVGCCWSLMLVMFGVGLGSLTVMLVLGALTAIEKNLPSGRRLTYPLGVALLLAATYAVAG